MEKTKPNSYFAISWIRRLFCTYVLIIITYLCSRTVDSLLTDYFIQMTRLLGSITSLATWPRPAPPRPHPGTRPSPVSRPKLFWVSFRSSQILFKRSSLFRDSLRQRLLAATQRRPLRLLLRVRVGDALAPGAGPGGALRAPGPAQQESLALR